MISHPIPPVWNSDSRILILGTMPSPTSRESGFFYMHPQNRFWTVMEEIFGEKFEYKNNGMKADVAERKSKAQKLPATPDLPAAITTHTAKNISAAIAERREFLLRHNLAIWDVLASCEITGAANSTIKNAVPNNFTEILEGSKIQQVFCTGKTAFNLWKKHCAKVYEERYNLTVHCLPSTSPANAQWRLEKLMGEYRNISQAYFSMQ
ncbi:MAG: uracil-DNA glycosylase family protein [Treponema sp.]|nr:uracil-DNA glycosylase family protein [Treponema sp.]